MSTYQALVGLSSLVGAFFFWMVGYLIARARSEPAAAAAAESGLQAELDGLKAQLTAARTTAAEAEAAKAELQAARRAAAEAEAAKAEVRSLRAKAAEAEALRA
jgi:multidrug efflux pump subunit AcrA (membrane-fusion protein)